MTTAGQFAVSPSGAATYNIPVQIPPGIAGMEPRLSLNYNSQGGNGLLGIGWSLGGLSSITRCAQTKSQDGKRGAISLSTNDRFCLDGQRLMLIAGSYGTANSEYRTEIESFSRITYSGTNFTVQSKAGLTMLFAPVLTKTAVITWGLSKITDVAGNYLAVSYNIDSTNNQFQPSRIDYTGNSSQQPTNSVQFTYDSTRLDAVPMYLAGVQMKSTQRLAKVATYVGSNKIKEYRLAYSAQANAGDRSKLASVTECDAVGVCLPSVSVGWETSGNSFSTYVPSLYFQSGNASIYAEANRIWFVDANGDGFLDHVLRDSAGGINVALSNGARFVSTPSFNYQSGAAALYGETNRIWFADINGDGMADHVVRDSAGGINVALSTGTSFIYTPSFNFNAGGTASIYAENNRMWFADVNGDGLLDFVIRDSAGGMNVRVNNGTSFVSTPSFNYQSGVASIYAENNRIWFADINGDGMADHVVRDSAGGINVALSTGTSFIYTPSFNFNAGGTAPIYAENNRMWLADMNGDGLVDFVIRDSAGGMVVRVFSPVGEAASRVKSIANAGVTTLTFKPLTNPATYTKDTGTNKAIYPQIDLQPPMYVVASVQTSNGVGGANTVHYTYGGLKAEMGTGRGMLGFRWINAKEQATGIESYTEYRQNWPYTGWRLKARPDSRAQEAQAYSNKPRPTTPAKRQPQA